MKETVTTAVMRRMDEQEIKKGTPAGTLMKRAGQAVVSAYGFNGKTAIVCGTGNNAGDGYVIASEIYDGTRECVLFLLEEKFSNDGKFYFDVCKKKNIPIKFFTEETDLSVYDTVVDCIFGTGYRGLASLAACRAKVGISAGQIPASLAGMPRRCCISLTATINFFAPAAWVSPASASPTAVARAWSFRWALAP